MLNSGEVEIERQKAGPPSASLANSGVATSCSLSPTTGETVTLGAEIKQLLLDEKAKHEGETALTQALVTAVLRLADEIEEIRARMPDSAG